MHTLGSTHLSIHGKLIISEWFQLGCSYKQCFWSHEEKEIIKEKSNHLFITSCL